MIPLLLLPRTLHDSAAADPARPEDRSDATTPPT